VVDRIGVYKDGGCLAQWPKLVQFVLGESNMKSRHKKLGFLTLCAGTFAVVAGCASEVRQGKVWEVTSLATEDLCNDPTVPYRETFEYRVTFDGPAATLHIGDGKFAAGVLEGCDLRYETVVWAEKREEGNLRWQLTGSASIYTGGETCLLDSGKDWLGSEVVEIVYSEIPDIEAGCTYTMELEGVYLGEGGE
jgi:hypothetical protein